ncbi:MAG: WD40/YVTN/BNR-like repeat-containing protein [Candidatus Binatia bacterium]
MSRFRLSTWWLAGVSLVLAACHGGVPEDIPSADTRKITIADRFYDVVAFDEKRAIVVGYAGKILATEDAGYTWKIVASGTDKSLYSIRFPDTVNGWIVGQDGLILHSADGGATWSKQASGASVYLFSVDFVDAQRGWAVGDEATWVTTVDGGATWKLNKLGSDEKLTADEALLASEPVLYDVEFLDAKTGWIVGEFGNIYHTTDGGETWKTQQESLLGGDGIFDTLDIPTFFGVSFVDAQNGIVAGLDSRIARTRDGGATWKFEKIEAKEALVDPLYQPFQFPDTTAWAVGAAGIAVRQATANEPWDRASLGGEVNTWLRGMTWIDKSNGWIVGGFGLILHTTDGGQTWLPSLG